MFNSFYVCFSLLLSLSSLQLYFEKFRIRFELLSFHSSCKPVLFEPPADLELIVCCCNSRQERKGSTPDDKTQTRRQQVGISQQKKQKEVVQSSSYI